MGRRNYRFGALIFNPLILLLKSKRQNSSAVKSKYIIIKQGGVEVPLVFSKIVTHEDIATKDCVISAGFCELDGTGKWIVGGRSLSLNLMARPQDAQILNEHLCG